MSLETSLLADRKLDAFALGLFFSYPGHELPRRYCFTLVQWQKSRKPSGVYFFSGEKMDAQNKPNSKCRPVIVNFNPGFSG